MRQQCDANMQPEIYSGLCDHESLSSYVTCIDPMVQLI
jgi:hypothetical protein